jgi:hypothetical protein
MNLRQTFIAYGSYSGESVDGMSTVSGCVPSETLPEYDGFTVINQ